jgi:hypothetical protein
MLGVGLLTVPISLTDNGDIAKGMNYDHAAAIPGFTDCLRREQPNTVGRSEMLGRGAKKREPKCFVRAGFQWLRQRKRSGRRGCRRGHAVSFGLIVAAQQTRLYPRQDHEAETMETVLRRYSHTNASEQSEGMIVIRSNTGSHWLVKSVDVREGPWEGTLRRSQSFTFQLRPAA